MKRLISLVLCFALMFTLISAVNVSAGDFQVSLQIDNPYMMVNGAIKEIDPGRGTAPVIVNGRTLVPIRAIVEQMGGTVGWDSDSQAVILNYNSNTVMLVINSYTAYVNGSAKQLDVAPAVINERTMLPIRFVAENFDFNVGWVAETSTITVTKNKSIAAGAVMKVHFIDVGQGDSAFIELPNGETMLIDAGPARETSANYIASLGYSAIDYVVATHPDADHITGMPSVLRRFKVGTFYMPDKIHTTNIFEEMLNALETNGCSVEAAVAGKSILSGNLAASFIAPVKSYSDNNASSAVVRLVYGYNSFLFTGDIEGESESDIINSGYSVKADVLKVAHHGSDSSTGEAFLNAVSPKIAVISVGRNNKYNHPSTVVLSKLQSHGISVYRTDESGSIVIESDGNDYSIKSSGASYQPTVQTPAVQKPAVQQPVIQKPVVQQPSSGTVNSQVVYKTKTGSKYHMDGCSYLKSKIQTTVSDAKAAGLSPCSRCNPPG